MNARMPLNPSDLFNREVFLLLLTAHLERQPGTCVVNAEPVTSRRFHLLLTPHRRKRIQDRTSLGTTKFTVMKADYLLRFAYFALCTAPAASSVGGSTPDTHR